MKYLYVFILSACFFLPLASAQAQQNQPSSADYQLEIARHRAHEDSIFKFSDKSPLAPGAKATFKTLEYFPVDQAFNVKAKFVRTANEGVFKMPTTTDRRAAYLKYGELHFTLQGQALQLNVYQNQDLIKQPKYLNYLFIPFTDATTGQETYATGRYLDFSIPQGQDSVWLDFNLAYNPYCAYGDGYSCPIPPKENNLPVRIEAGVKTYEKEENAKEGLGELAFDKSPEYPGGAQSLHDFLYRKFRMPLAAKKDRVSGTVVLSFIVQADGSIADLTILKPLRKDIDKEVLKAANQMLQWTPGEKNEMPVNVRMTVPFHVPRKRISQDYD